MNLLDKIDKLIVDTVVTGDIATNTAKGSIDVIGGKCPDGMRYCKKRKTCVPINNESSVVGGSYISGTTVNIIGSQQTRTCFTTKRDILDLARKEEVDDKQDDPTKTNILGRKGLKFDKKSGAYIPSLWGEE